MPIDGLIHTSNDTSLFSNTAIMLIIPRRPHFGHLGWTFEASAYDIWRCTYLLWESFLSEFLRITMYTRCVTPQNERLVGINV